MELKDLDKIAVRRAYKHNKKARDMNLTEIPIAWYKKFFRDNIHRGCSYCGKQLKLKDVPPYKDVPSIDHIIPIRGGYGGKNIPENICLSCVECNLIKGTISQELFIKLRNLLKREGLLEQYYDETFRSRLADKIERVDLKEW